MAYQDIPEFNIKTVVDLLTATQKAQDENKADMESWTRVNNILKTVLAPTDGGPEFEGIMINGAKLATDGITGPAQAKQVWSQAHVNALLNSALEDSDKVHDADPYNKDGVPSYSDDYVIDTAGIAESKREGFYDLIAFAEEINAEDVIPTLKEFTDNLDDAIENGRDTIDGNEQLFELFDKLDATVDSMRRPQLSNPDAEVLTDADKAHIALLDLKENNAVELVDYDYDAEGPC